MFFVGGAGCRHRSLHSFPDKNSVKWDPILFFQICLNRKNEGSCSGICEQPYNAAHTRGHREYTHFPRKY